MENENCTRIQDIFLREVLKKKVLVTLFLANGFRMDGIVAGFDDTVIIFDTDGKLLMIYKHVVSTLAPTEPVQLGG